MKLKLVVNGACGRMGKEIIKAALGQSGVEIIGACDYPAHPQLGQDAGVMAGTGGIGVKVSSELPPLLEEAGAIIDFSAPLSSLKALELASQKGVPFVCGTTGFEENEIERFKKAAYAIPIVLSSNMSLGMNLLSVLISQAAKSLGEGYDLEIFEAHHRHKKDAPSGSAYLLADALLEARGLARKDLVYDRTAVKEARKPESVGVSVMRGGDITGIHRVYMAGEGEFLELSHTATSRSCFANGAVKAAIWAAGQKPGFYTMRDVLRL